MTSVEWSMLPPPLLCPRPHSLRLPCISFPSHSLDMGWEYGTLRRTHLACKIFCDGACQPAWLIDLSLQANRHANMHSLLSGGGFPCPGSSSPREDLSHLDVTAR